MQVQISQCLFNGLRMKRKKRKIFQFFPKKFLQMKSNKIDIKEKEVKKISMNSKVFWSKERVKKFEVDYLKLKTLMKYQILQ